MKTNRKTSAEIQVTSWLFWFATLLFFASGSTGLAYQVIWFRRFAHVWGSTSLAFAAVGGSFLFGLGLGAYVFGRLADRLRRPLLWYGACEIAIGLLALTIPREIQWLVDASVRLYAQLPDDPLTRFTAQFAITLLVIGPACVLMGGTLPLLIRQLTAREGALDQATAWLYAVNTLGAAMGCYLTGFHLLPAIGLYWTNVLAATMNLTIGIVAVLASLRGAAVDLEEPAKPDTSESGNMRRGLFADRALWAAYMAAMLSGLGALVLEMTWTRQLALVLGGSSYAFTSTLFVVLVGIALGSLFFHLYLRDFAGQVWLSLTIFGSLVFTILTGKLSLLWLCRWVAKQHLLRDDVNGNALVCVSASAVIEFLPALAMGALFPLLVDLTRQSAANVGRAVGSVYAWNTLGSILGASLTSVLLFPLIGTTNAIALAAGLYVLALQLALPWKWRLPRFASLAVGAVLVAWLAWPGSPWPLNAGMYLYGDPVNRAPVQVKFFREGPSCNVVVTEQGTAKDRNYSLRVNGKVDASTGLDMTTQLGVAYFPRMFQPHAREVLVIGFGSGSTLGASLLFPDTHVTCCEIEPAVLGGAEFFASCNHRPLDKWVGHEPEQKPVSAGKPALPPSTLEMVFGDGRTTLQGSDKKYDLIISEPSNPWLAGVSNLFTQEFFKTAKAHLNEGGVLAQWIQAYNFKTQDYLMIVRTMQREFPHFGMVSLANGVDTLLLASTRPLEPNVEQIDRLQLLVDASPEISADLRKYFGTTNLRTLLLLHYVLDEKALANLLLPGDPHDINTDLNLRLEFDAPLDLFTKLKGNAVATAALSEAAYENAGWTERMAGTLGLDVHAAKYHLDLADQYWRTQHPERALRHYKEAITLEPDNAAAYLGAAKVLLSQRKRDEAMPLLAELLKRHPDNARGHGMLAQQLYEAKSVAEALPHYREALRLRPEVAGHPESIVWANNLAWALATSPDDKLRNGAEAVRWATLACEADKFKQPMMLDTLAAAYAENGQFDQAQRYIERSLDRAEAERQNVTEPTKRQQYDLALRNARRRLQLYKSARPYRDG